MLNIVSQIEKHAHHKPDKTCLSFITSKEELHLTYSELHQKVLNVASYLAKRLKPQDRVLLVYPSCLEFIIAWLGCVYAGMIAVPIMPPNNDKLIDKSLNILKNSSPKLALIHSHLTKDNQGQYGGIDALYFSAIEQPCSFQPKILLDHIAFLQYTSGSTGTPKGVMIDHHNLNHNLKIINDTMAMDKNPVQCSWLPPHHDMGLIGFILAPLFGGHHSILMPPYSFLQNPLLWLQTISKYQVNFSGGPNFAYDYCVKRIKEHKKEGLDLSSWRVAANGAEPVRQDTLEQFYQAFKNYGFSKDAFYPCYGLAEATLLVSTRIEKQPVHVISVDKHELQNNQIKICDKTTEQAYSLVSSGLVYQSVKIVNPDTLLPCTDGQVGEVWIKSQSVSKGYWQNESATLACFKAHYIGQIDSEPYLRSGDLGFISQQELYITGRIKDLLIFYGKNYYPQDIEQTINNVDLISLIGRSAAYSIPDNGREKLGIMVEVKNQFAEEDVYLNIVKAIKKSVITEHQLDVEDIVFIPFKTLPHTTSGKIRRQVCLQNMITKQIPIVYHWQKQVTEIL